MQFYEPKSKTRVTVDVPETLRDSLREAWEYVLEAMDDPDLAIDYGDAIQCGAVCGGRTSEAPQVFAFTFYPPGDERRGRWYLELTSRQFEDLADGHMTRISMFVCRDEACRQHFASAQDCIFCDYRDDEVTQRKAQRLRELSAGVQNKRDWVARLLEVEPEVGALDAIGHYNGLDNVGERLGWFSVPEMEALLAALRSGVPERAVAGPGSRDSAQAIVEPDIHAELARAFVDALLSAELLELTGSRNRPVVIAKVTDLFERSASIGIVAEALEDTKGVAELFASDEQLTALLRDARRALTNSAV